MREMTEVKSHQEPVFSPSRAGDGTCSLELSPQLEMKNRVRPRKESAHAALRLLCLVSSSVSMSFMLMAEQNSVLDIYGLQLPVSSKWSYSDSFIYLVGVSAAVIAYSFPLLLFTLAKLHRNTPLISSRRFAWTMFAADQVFAYAMVSAGSAAAGISNLNRTGIHHSPRLPDFCKPLHIFCDRVAVSIAFSFFSCLLLAASSLLDVICLSSTS